MPSMRSIGRADSRMMPSSLSIRRRRIADMPRLGRQHVLRLVHQPQALGLDLVADARGQRADALGIGLRLGLGAHRRAAIRRGVFLGAAPPRVSRSASRSASCCGADQVDPLLAPLGHLGLARGEHALLLGHGARPRLVRRACASDCAFDCSATAIARCCSASSSVRRRSISSACTSRSRAMRSSSTARSDAMRARSTASRAEICARSDFLLLRSRARARRRSAARRAAPRARAPARAARTRARGRCRAPAARCPGSCCGSGSSCPARCRCASSCAARSARSAGSGPRRRRRWTD